MRRLRILLLLIALSAVVYVVLIAVPTWNRVSETLANTPRHVRLTDLKPEQQSLLHALRDPAVVCTSGLTIQEEAWRCPSAFSFLTPNAKSRIEQRIAEAVVHARLNEEQRLDYLLNALYWGQPRDTMIIGLDAASRTYLNKAPADLTRAELLSLIAMIRSPNNLNPQYHAGQNRARVGELERALAAQKRRASSTIAHDAVSRSRQDRNQSQCHRLRGLGHRRPERSVRRAAGVGAHLRR